MILKRTRKFHTLRRLKSHGCDKVLVQCAYRVCDVSLYSPEPLLVPQRGPFLSSSVARKTTGVHRMLWCSRFVLAPSERESKLFRNVRPGFALPLVVS